MIVVSQLHLPLELQLLIWSHGVIPCGSWLSANMW